ncbi:MAG TPA: protein translocase subunit SecD, partial [Ornithinibacter sp.]|nr:protein translocase subunit SecD [Ornithinibacter sp.]
MSSKSQRSAARRALLALTVLSLALAGLLAGAMHWSDAQATPKLGLDLKGGTQIILEPKTVEGQTVTAEQLNQARNIIVERVDAGGVSGAEVTTQGDRNIVVSIPEIPTQEVRDAISKSSQLQFRPVLAIAAGSPQPQPTVSPSGTASPDPSASPAASGAPAASPSPTPTVASSASPTNNSSVPEALMAPTPSPSATASPSPTPSPAASVASPTSPTDLAWITPELSTQFELLNCADPAALDNLIDDPAKPLVTCQDDDSVK